jgi:membrane fusion protein (multidrug efflux system)
MEQGFSGAVTRVKSVTSMGNKLLLLPLFFALLFMQSCTTTSGKENMVQPPLDLPVLTLRPTAVTTYQEFPATLEGSKDIEIRPQVDGQLEHIYVDEGDYVHKGQRLFRINAQVYSERFNNASANLSAARANLSNAKINVSKLTPLVQNKVVSEVQLKSAVAAREASEANVLQAASMVGSAKINLDYTLITAPADGYIGRIPFKTGSLVSTINPEALTVLSEIKNVLVYFSLSENDFIQFKKEFSGKNIQEKIKHLPPVDLLLADGSLYPHKGKIELVSGQFDVSKGSISFRASFPNNEGLLRSGNTGKIRIPHLLSSVILVPQEATDEIQDKVFVFVVGDGNKVKSIPIAVSGKSGTYYLVEKGIQAGDKIVYAGLERLRDGAVINPRQVTPDSLKKTM